MRIVSKEEFEKLYKEDEQKAINYANNLLKEKELDRTVFMAISWRLNLSENFIETFQDHLDWFYLSKYQKMSLDFLIRKSNKISLKGLNENIYIKENIKKKFKNYIKLIK